jgi:hypothetical protein
MAQVVEPLIRYHKALSSNPNTAKKKKNTHMKKLENGKMRPVETIPGMRGGG